MDPPNSFTTGSTRVLYITQSFKFQFERLVAGFGEEENSHP